MEALSERDRYESGALGRECEQALAVAALQGLVLMEVDYE